MCLKFSARAPCSRSVRSAAMRRDALKAGDVLHIGAEIVRPGAPRRAREDERPQLTSAWQIGVVYGPHGAPDFFLDQDIETLFATDYEVHFNSARTGVRLIGPKPRMGADRR